MSPADVMAGQIDRLVCAVGLPGVRFGILPMGRTLLHVPWHGYWVVDDVVFIETITDEHRVRDPGQVAVYNTLTDRLWSAATEGEHARTILARFAQPQHTEPPGRISAAPSRRVAGSIQFSAAAEPIPPPGGVFGVGELVNIQQHRIRWAGTRETGTSPLSMRSHSIPKVSVAICS
jgi:hypothetical protein